MNKISITGYIAATAVMYIAVQVLLAIVVLTDVNCSAR